METEAYGKVLGEEHRWKVHLFSGSFKTSAEKTTGDMSKRPERTDSG